jgi:hypothetical protein
MKKSYTHVRAALEFTYFDTIFESQEFYMTYDEEVSERVSAIDEPFNFKVLEKPASCLFS